jgi:hypothetical protein
MKKLTTILSTLALAFVSVGQEPCATGRFSSDVYPNVTVTSNITYGSNLNFNGSTKTLKLDFYEPTGDTMAKRPLIVWVHGGSFLGGTKTDGDMIALATSFAKKGYACASIDYRTGFFPIDSVNSVKAVMRAVHDLKGAVRFFYKDQEDQINQFKIDTNNIFIGGTSAGAITALHYAYLDRTCEINPYVNQTTLNGIGGLEGISGNPCYSTDVKGVINLCGALASYAWLEAGEVPLCSMHGTVDGTVKYSRGIVNPGVPLMYLDGSRMIHERAEAEGVSSVFYTWYGANHNPFAGTSPTAAAYMDTTINFVRDFLIGQLGCTNPILQAENAPFGTASLYAYTECASNVPYTDCTGLGVNEQEENLYVLYPNPSNGSFEIEMGNVEDYTVQILDLAGRLQATKSAKTSHMQFDNLSLNYGVYIVHITNEKGISQTIKVLIK